MDVTILTATFLFGMLTWLLWYSRSKDNIAWKFASAVPPLSILRSCYRMFKRRRERHWLNSLRDSLSRYDIQGSRKIRMGNPAGDGGYVIIDGLGVAYDALLSYGIGADVSFEIAFCNHFRPICAHLYDHTIHSLPGEHPSFVFHKEGISATGSGNLGRLEKHIADNALSGRTIFFKIDVEGAEYSSLLSATATALSPMAQIVIEIHDVTPGNRLLFPLLHRLNRNYWLVHIHANNMGGRREWAGTHVPTTLELTYLSKSYAPTAQIASDELPGPLDRPNNPKSLDWKLSEFLEPSSVVSQTVPTRA